MTSSVDMVPSWNSALCVSFRINGDFLVLALLHVRLYTLLPFAASATATSSACVVDKATAPRPWDPQQIGAPPSRKTYPVVDLVVSGHPAWSASVSHKLSISLFAEISFPSMPFEMSKHVFHAVHAFLSDVEACCSADMV